MKQEVVTIKQDIEIWYNSPEARDAAINRLKKDTNWIFISEGNICNETIQFKLGKTKSIEIINPH